MHSWLVCQPVILVPNKCFVCVFNCTVLHFLLFSVALHWIANTLQFYIKYIVVQHLKFTWFYRSLAGKSSSLGRISNCPSLCVARNETIIIIISLISVVIIIVIVIVIVIIVIVIVVIRSSSSLSPWLVIEPCIKSLQVDNVHNFCYTCNILDLAIF